MAPTTVSHADLANAAKMAEDTGESIALNLSRLLNEIETTVSSAFKGRASSALHSTSNELGNELKKLLEALNTMASNMGTSNVQYAGTDQDASQEINNVGSSYLPGAQPIISALS